MEKITDILQGGLQFTVGIVPKIYTWLLSMVPDQYDSVARVGISVVCIFLIYQIFRHTVNKIVILAVITLLTPFVIELVGDFADLSKIPMVGGLLTNIKDFF